MLYTYAFYMYGSFVRIWFIFRKAYFHFNRYTYKIDLRVLFGSRNAAGYINL